MTDHTFLVTGGAGFLGSHLVERLLDNGNSVICFDNEFRGIFDNLSGAKKKHQDSLIIKKGDITKWDDWSSVSDVGEIAGVYHLAAINGTPSFYSIPDVVLEVNVLGTRNAVEFMRRHDIPYLSFASSPEAYGIPSEFPTPETCPLTIPDLDNPRWSYGASKAIGEVYCCNFARKYDFRCSIIRYNNTYGPRDHSGHVIPDILGKIFGNEPLTVECTGNETRSFCYITDAIDASLLIQEKQQKQIDIFNVGFDSETKIRDLVEMLRGLSGTNKEPTFIPKKQAGTYRRLPNIDKIKELGYLPKVSLEEGLKLTFDWYKKTQSNKS